MRVRSGILSSPEEIKDVGRACPAEWGCEVGANPDPPTSH